MIKLRTMYDLYNMSLHYKIEEKKRFLSEQGDKVETYLFKMNEVAPILSVHINYSDALNGKVNKLPDNVLALNETPINYANMILKTYYELRSPIEIVSNEIKTLKKQKISYAIYKDIINSHNRKVTNYLLDTGKTFENKFFGLIKFCYKENTASTVNWNESNKAKKALLEKGLIPYKKADEQAAIERGEEYKGIKWLVKGYKTGVLIIKWTVPQIVKDNLNKDIHNFKFSPSRGNYGIMSLLSGLYTDDFNPDKYENA